MKRRNKQRRRTFQSGKTCGVRPSTHNAHCSPLRHRCACGSVGSTLPWLQLPAGPLRRPNEAAASGALPCHARAHPAPGGARFALRRLPQLRWQRQHAHTCVRRGVSCRAAVATSPTPALTRTCRTCRARAEPVRICVTGGSPFVVPASRVPGGGNGVAVQTLDQVRDEAPLAANVVYDPHDPAFPLGGLDIEYRCAARARSRTRAAPRRPARREGAANGSGWLLPRRLLSRVACRSERVARGATRSRSRDSSGHAIAQRCGR